MLDIFDDKFATSNVCLVLLELQKCFACEKVSPWSQHEIPAAAKVDTMQD